MGSLKRDYPGIPLIALTATANDRVKQDVMTNLRMDRPLMLTSSFNRANLKYFVRKKTRSVLSDIADFIKGEHAGESGIIYCSSKKQCEDTAERLRREHRIKCMHYHAGMDKDDRLRVQVQWLSGEIDVICATIACVRVLSLLTLSADSLGPAALAWASTSPTCASSVITRSRRVSRRTTRCVRVRLVSARRGN
jgi:ATP-dependent helicase YprA (DUF1998 family)